MAVGTAADDTTARAPQYAVYLVILALAACAAHVLPSSRRLIGQFAHRLIHSDHQFKVIFRFSFYFFVNLCLAYAGEDQLLYGFITAVFLLLVVLSKIWMVNDELGVAACFTLVFVVTFILHVLTGSPWSDFYLLNSVVCIILGVSSLVFPPL